MLLWQGVDVGTDNNIGATAVGIASEIGQPRIASNIGHPVRSSGRFVTWALALTNRVRICCWPRAIVPATFSVAPP